MTLSHEQAAETLKDVQRAERRSAEAYGYKAASPHLIIWGLVWLLGYSGTDLRPDLSGMIWPAVILAGVIAGSVAARMSHKGRSEAKQTWRFFGLALIIVMFFAAVFAIFSPATPAQQGAFVPLLVGAIYAGAGLWVGTRFVVAGVAIIALTLGGFFELREHFLLWMAFVGGGGLILAGFWFRRI